MDEHGEFCVRGGVVDVYPASEAQPVRLEFIGDIVESVRRFDAATQRSLAALDQVAIFPQRELLPDEAAPRRSVQTRSVSHGPRLRPPGRRRTRRLRDRRRPGPRPGARRPVARQRGRRRARGRAVPAFEELAASWDEVTAWLAIGRRLSQLALEDGTPSLHVSCPPQPRVPRPHRRLGRRNPAGARPRRDDALRGRDARSGRAHGRAAGRLRGPRRGRSPTPTIWSRRPSSSRPASCRRASICPPRRWKSSARPTCSRRSAARTNGADRRRTRSSRTSATSRSATSSSTWTTASAGSSA